MFSIDTPQGSHGVILSPCDRQRNGHLACPSAFLKVTNAGNVGGRMLIRVRDLNDSFIHGSSHAVSIYSAPAVYTRVLVLGDVRLEKDPKHKYQQNMIICVHHCVCG